VNPSARHSASRPTAPLVRPAWSAVTWASQLARALKAWQPSQPVGSSATPHAQTQPAWAAQQVQASTNPPGCPASARNRPAWQARTPKAWPPSQPVGAWAAPPVQIQPAWAAQQVGASASPLAHRPAWQAQRVRLPVASRVEAPTRPASRPIAPAWLQGRIAVSRAGRLPSDLGNRPVSEPASRPHPGPGGSVVCPAPARQPARPPTGAPGSWGGTRAGARPAGFPCRRCPLAPARVPSRSSTSRCTTLIASPGGPE
jgi:hypothetical protein